MSSGDGSDGGNGEGCGEGKGRKPWLEGRYIRSLISKQELNKIKKCVYSLCIVQLKIIAEL